MRNLNAIELHHVNGGAGEDLPVHTFAGTITSWLPLAGKVTAVAALAAVAYFGYKKYFNASEEVAA